MKPWPNGSAIIVPRSVVYTITIAIVGAIMTWTAAGIWYGGRITERVEQIGISLERIEGADKTAHAQAQANAVAIAELKGRIKGAAGGQR